MGSFWGSFAVGRALCGLLHVTCLSAALTTPQYLKVPEHFSLAVIARVDKARELAVAANGDLLVGTLSREVMLVADAEGTPKAPHVFARVTDHIAAGVALSGDSLYIGSEFAVWRVPYHVGERVASTTPVRIARVRPKGHGGHITTSVAVGGQRLYVSVGSSCDACDPELDDTRATVMEGNLDGSDLHPRAVRIRNAVALAYNSTTGHLWAIPNGQDALEHGHPYEIADPITLHPGVANYGWPHCFENQRKVEPSADCTGVVVPRVIFPAYNAPIGAVIYPSNPKGKYAFPAAYAGGLFVALHGSWHVPLVPPRVAFVALEGDLPKTPADWNNPTTQWQEFVGGFQEADGHRLGRPTGIAVGPEGSLFVADDHLGVIYRIRYAP